VPVAAGSQRLPGAGRRPTRRLRSRPVRFVFTAYLVLIGLGLAFYIAIGIANHQ
jgi:hypothetical protein